MAARTARFNNFTVPNPALAVVDLAAINALNPNGLPEFEYDAYDHWVFDKGGAGGLEGRVNKKMLTLSLTGGYTWNANSIAAAGYDNGIKSDYADTTDWTIAATLKYPSAGGIIGGNFNGSAGASAIVAASGANEVVSIAGGPATVQQDLNLTATPAVGSWLTAAFALKYSGGIRRRTLYSRGQFVTQEDYPSKNTSPVPISFANSYLNSAPYATTVTEFFEVMIFPFEMSAQDMALLRLRQIARAARRGISVT